MKKESEFVAHLTEVFRLFGEIRSRRMFGGYGIYHRDLMIGLVAGDVLYLKVDAETAPEFSRAGSVPFEYEKNGKRMKMSFHSAPEVVFDDAEMARAWARRALEAALRSRQRSTQAKKR